jgi:ureidoacrylate peracid hydrolase
VAVDAALGDHEKPMHKFSMPEEIIARVVERVGRAHPFDKLEASKTAFVVIDMQNYYLKPGYLGDVPLARDIVPTINKFAADLRERGAHVIWVRNASNGTRENWSVYHEWLMSPEFCERRYATLDVEHEGHQLWAELVVKSEDSQIVKRASVPSYKARRISRFCLRSRGIDTVLIGGTATNVCCDVSARDAMMLNFKVIMVPDVLATWTDAEHNATLANFYSIFGDVQTCDEVLASLSRGQEVTAA